MSVETNKQEERFIEVEAPKVPKASNGSQPARRKGSVLERTAFWSSLIMTFLLVGFFFLVKAFSGITSQDLIILTIAGLICTILLLIRNRWVALIVAGAELYLFYEIWTQPFVVDSLSNPKGSNGGLGHFSGDVLIICCSLLAVVCSVGAVVQHFQFSKGKNRPTPRWYPVVVGLVIGMAIGAMHIGAIVPAPSTSSGLTYTNGVPTLHMNVNSFLLSSVTISKGSKLMLVDDSSEKHELYNGTWQNGSPVIEQEPGAPAVNDVKLSNDSVVIGPFNTAGTFHIFCTLHKGMILTIIVQ